LRSTDRVPHFLIVCPYLTNPHSAFWFAEVANSDRRRSNGDR
jgi:hypothetical protein